MPTNTCKSTLLSRAKEIAPELVQTRRQIHANPELSFNEHKTVVLVAEQLKKLGYEPKVISGGIGLVAEIGPMPASTERLKHIVAIRADMDALPIEEANTDEYCSGNKGVMHACGHDAHTACALGAAKLLAEMHAKGQLPGRVRLIFQPAEETINEVGKSGATLVIEEGALENVAAAIALHVFPNLPAGMIALKNGALLAACDTFKIAIKGVGTHGAMPELGVDAIVVAAQVVQAIQTIVSRRRSALEPVVITLGGIKSATYRPNIVAAEVEIIGTARYFDSELSSLIKAELTRCCQIAESLGGAFTLEYQNDNPVLNNDPQLTQIVREAALKFLPADAIADATMEMGAEDFSFISAAVPSCFVVLGAAIENDMRKFHTSTFDIDESALPFGAAILAQSAIDALYHLQSLQSAQRG